MKTWRFLFIVLLSVFASPGAEAVSVFREELAEARAWTAARFEGKAPASISEAGLFVLANLDAVQKNAQQGSR